MEPKLVPLSSHKYPPKPHLVGACLLCQEEVSGRSPQTF